ncbi:uncharacterized protein LOC127875219 isoform X2 [Dreissena polymorpha]|uniref:Uncharacterized protein n=2 Tax=Dreissena polymorpha TaxID=45954 RepID=A0A9D4L8A0_DREPO|nr:uncharacterized protein LOC127875219 isoform X2 [Dreissena polymorpha]KAH3853270.1 hypothetical protein DPMN_095792 [Dreissena polymorpha]
MDMNEHVATKNTCIGDTCEKKETHKDNGEHKDSGSKLPTVESCPDDSASSGPLSREWLQKLTAEDKKLLAKVLQVIRTRFLPRRPASVMSRPPPPSLAGLRSKSCSACIDYETLDLIKSKNNRKARSEVLYKRKRTRNRSRKQEFGLRTLKFSDNSGKIKDNQTKQKRMDHREVIAKKDNAMPKKSKSKVPCKDPAIPTRLQIGRCSPGMPIQYAKSDIETQPTSDEICSSGSKCSTEDGQPTTPISGYRTALPIQKPLKDACSTNFDANATDVSAHEGCDIDPKLSVSSRLATQFQNNPAKELHPFEKKEVSSSEEVYLKFPRKYSEEENLAKLKEIASLPKVSMANIVASNETVRRIIRSNSDRSRSIQDTIIAGQRRSASLAARVKCETNTDTDIGDKGCDCNKKSKSADGIELIEGPNTVSVSSKSKSPRHESLTEVTTVTEISTSLCSIDSASCASDSFTTSSLEDTNDTPPIYLQKKFRKKDRKKTKYPESKSHSATKKRVDHDGVLIQKGKAADVCGKHSRTTPCAACSPYAQPQSLVDITDSGGDRTIRRKDKPKSSNRSKSNKLASHRRRSKSAKSKSPLSSKPAFISSGYVGNRRCYSPEKSTEKVPAARHRGHFKHLSPTAKTNASPKRGCPNNTENESHKLEKPPLAPTPPPKPHQRKRSNIRLHQTNNAMTGDDNEKPIILTTRSVELRYLASHISEVGGENLSAVKYNPMPPKSSQSKKAALTAVNKARKIRHTNQCRKEEVSQTTDKTIVLPTVVTIPSVLSSDGTSPRSYVTSTWSTHSLTARSVASHNSAILDSNCEIKNQTSVSISNS